MTVTSEFFMPPPAGARDAVTDGWVPVSERLPPEEMVVLVYTPDRGDGDGDRLDFDCIIEGGWNEHNNSYDHFMMVGGARAAGPDSHSIGPSEDAPYTHWKAVTKPGATRPAESVAQGGEAVRYESRPVDKGTPPLNPKWTPCLREDYEDFIAGKTNGFREYRATPTPATGSGGEAVAAEGVPGYGGIPIAFDDPELRQW